MDTSKRLGPSDKMVTTTKQPAGDRDRLALDGR